MAVQRITPQELKSKLDRGEDIAILDVRTEEAYDASPMKIKGAIRIPPGQLVENLDRIPCADEYVTYCT
jgi:rhodanese-related sulfurtransferase